MPIDLLTLPTTTIISQAKKMTVNNFEVSLTRRVTDSKCWQGLHLVTAQRTRHIQVKDVQVKLEVAFSGVTSD